MASAADGGLNVPEGALPPQFADLKREIAAATPGFETKLPAAWADLIAELATRTDQIAQAGSNVSCPVILRTTTRITYW
jgi:hypothetical protein